jgi:hypothetical protein
MWTGFFTLRIVRHFRHTFRALKANDHISCPSLWSHSVPLLLHFIGNKQIINRAQTQGRVPRLHLSKSKRRPKNLWPNRYILIYTVFSGNASNVLLWSVIISVGFWSFRLGCRVTETAVFIFLTN